jgi:ribosomal protein S18 acetylase RimI-like enzyme
VNRIAYRPARADDLAATYEVFRAATNDLYRQRNLPLIPEHTAPPERPMAFRRHALEHDADRFWVAESDGQMVGFGCATVRGDLWYLAALHVLPRWQRHGIGGNLLRRCLAAGGAATRRVLISDSLNPASNGLYARHGLVQRHALIELTGCGRGDPVGEPIPLDTEPIPWPEIDRLDRGALGCTRRVDHELWLTSNGQTLKVLRRGGEIIAYGYVSADGIGPAAGEDAAALAQFVSAAAAEADPSDRLAIKLPGNAAPAIGALLDLGFVYRHVLLICGSVELPGPERYAVSSGDALL